MPTIAFITNCFPEVPFIYNEVIGLRKRNVSIKTFSIRKPNSDSFSKGNQELFNTTTYLLPINSIEFVRSHFHFILKNPYKYLRTLLFVLSRKYHRVTHEEFKNQSSINSDRLRTFVHFCEAVHFAKLLKNDRSINHIHAHYASHATTFAMVASLLTNISFSFTAHAYDIWYDRLFLGEKVDAAKFVITCTQFGKNEIQKSNSIRDPHKISTIYHGIDVIKFDLRRKKEKKSHFNILTIGRLTGEKAQKNLIYACKILKDEGLSFNCDIIGDGPLLNYLKLLIHEQGLEDVVKLVGRVFQEDLYKYYNKADMFVLPSVSENLPNVLLESLACGLPVIASNIAAIPELIKHRETGILVQPNDIQGLVNAVKLLNQDIGLANQLSENGRRFVCQNFDAEVFLDKIFKLYKSQGIINCDFNHSLS